MDDPLHLLRSPFLQGGEAWWEADWRSWSYLVWVVVKDVFGMSAVAFHALNLVLHAGVAVTVFFTARKLAVRCDPPRCAEESLNLATLAGLLFAVHGAASEPLHYASQTTIQWVTLFSMLAAVAVLGVLQRTTLRGVLLTAMWLVFAAYSKEVGLFHAGTGVVLVIGALAPWRRWFQFASRHRMLVGAVGVCVLAAAAIFLSLSGWLTIAKGSLGGEQFWEHVLTQCRITWHYLARILVPVNLCSDHLVAISLSKGDGAAVAGGFGIGALLLVIGVLFARGRRIVALLLSLTLAPLLLRFLYPVHELFVEYRMYPAMPWFAILFAFAMQGLAARKNAPIILRFLPHAVVVILAIFSVLRAHDWRSPHSIGENVLAQYPDHVRVHSYLQAHERMAGQPEKAIERQKLLREAANRLFAYNRNSDQHHRRYIPRRVLSAVMAGEQMAAIAEVELDRPQDAIQRLNYMIPFMLKIYRGNDKGKGFAVLYRSRGLAYAAMDDPAAARADYERALESLPGDPQTIWRLKQLEEEPDDGAPPS